MSDLIPKLDISYLIVKALNGELEGTEKKNGLMKVRKIKYRI